jgi:hypothetical protein
MLPLLASDREPFSSIPKLLSIPGRPSTLEEKAECHHMKH